MGAGKEEIVPFFFFSHFALILALHARALSNGRKKKTKQKNDKKVTKTEKKRITSVDRLNVPLS